MEALAAVGLAGNILQFIMAEIPARVDDGHEENCARIFDKLEINHDVMKQKIHGLQHSLQRLQLEIEQKTNELKDLVAKIGATREGPERHLLKDRGNKFMFILMSLPELQKGLQVIAASSPRIIL